MAESTHRFGEDSGAGENGGAGETREPRRFFLDPEADGDAPRLTPEEQRHAATVLRMRPGDRLLGLDGRGGSRPLTVSRVQRSRVDVVAAGPWAHAPGPGQAGSSIPDVGVALSIPTSGHLEPLVDGLTQLGVARILPFVAAHTPVRSRTLPPRLQERLARIARTACKQSRRLWLPRIDHPLPLAERLAETEDHARACLDPEAPTRLADWCSNRSPTDSRPTTLFVGPEGGFSAEELELLKDAPGGMAIAWLGPHILRIETAAEAAAALALHLGTPRDLDGAVE